MLRSEILKNWESDDIRWLQKIRSLSDEYPAYTLETETGYGVAIPLDEEAEINEDFSNAKLRTNYYIARGEEKAKLYLTLTTDKSTNKDIFSALCEQFVYPGKYGEFRHEIVDSPIKWWMEMKQILGNRNVDEMIYDTLGELWVYDYFVRQNISVVWNGPKGSSVDFEVGEDLVEVKSTVSRSKKEITVHGKTQLTIPHDKKLFLFLCVFEMSSDTGYSINDIVYGLADDGYDVSEINRLLTKKGLDVGKSAREKKYILWNVYKYAVDDGFPKITDDSFVGGKMPLGINSISYTVDLAGVPCEIVYDGSM